MMQDEELRPVLERLLATRRAKVEDTQGGTRRGLRVLFTGSSGKNKLLAAQLFAHELAVDLFEIDLSRIVSKYVADTERNLDALFKAAQASDAALALTAAGLGAVTASRPDFVFDVNCPPLDTLRSKLF